MGKENQDESLEKEHMDYVEQTLVYLYVDGEVKQSEYSEGVVPLRIKTQSPKINEIMRRMEQDTASRLSSFNDELQVMVEEKLLGGIADPKIRRGIQERAIGRAIEFWEDRLGEPDLTTNEIMTGRRRVTRLNAKLEGLEATS